MELRQLEYFMAVCQEQHFTKAADVLNIAQPTLSQQIRNLEDDVGIPLFDRMGKKVALTEAGKILKHYGHRMFYELEQARSAIDDLNGLQIGKLTIGSLLTCTNYLLPPAILDFKRLYPNIELSVMGFRTNDIHKGLLDNELDLGVSFLPVDNEEFASIPLVTEELALAVPKSHPLASDDIVEMTDLEHASMIFLPDHFYMRQLIDSYAAEQGITLQPTLEMSTLESLVHMVAEGIGITILPAPYLANLDSEQVVTVKLEKPVLTREIGFIYRKDKYMCIATSTFVNLVTKRNQSI